MKATAERIIEFISELDTYDATQKKFLEQAQDNAAWAIERYADDVIYARAMTRLVRPLIAIHAEQGESAFLEAVKAVRNDAMRQLVNGAWRHNSTSMLQNAINQWESEALAKFIDKLRYFNFD